jgi:large subunit ribosomal protein L17
MRKRIAFRKLSKDSEHRWAMLRNMVTSLIHHERIITTTPKAKELRRVAENMVTHAKKGDLHHRRLAAGVVQERSAVVKLFEILGPRYKERPGGYTRIMKLAKPRRGDSADMSVIEFVDREGELRKARPATGSSGSGSVAAAIYGNVTLRRPTETDP